MKTAKLELTEEQIIYLLEMVEEQELSLKKGKDQAKFLKFVADLRSSLAQVEISLNAASA